MPASRQPFLRCALLLALAALPSCGGSPAAFPAEPRRALSPAPAKRAAPAPRAIVTKFLEALQRDDRAALEATTTGNIGWEIIPKRFGTLQSFDLRDDELAVDQLSMITASMRFKTSDLMFVIVVQNKDQEALVTNFSLIEVVRARVAARITQHIGSKLKLTATAGWPPESGAEGDLSKRLDSSIPLIGGGHMSLGRATVKNRDGNELELEVTEEKSRLKIDGRPVDQLAPGENVDFLWSMMVCTRSKDPKAVPPYECID